MKNIYLYIAILLCFSSTLSAQEEQTDTNVSSISFFSEIQGYRLLELLNDNNIEQLKRLNASIRMGITDVSDSRAKVVQRLNEAGIPVTAWLLLPKKDGYWLNASKGEKASKRYREFSTWTKNNKLKWERIGFSFEPEAYDSKITSRSYVSIAQVFFKRLLKNNSQELAKSEYPAVLGSIKNDGYRIETYISPYEYDANVTECNSWYNINGTFLPPSHEEIPIFFNHYGASDKHALAQHIVYGRQNHAKTVLIGSMNPNKPLSKIENAHPLNLEQIYHHLQVAQPRGVNIAIYGLEGAIKQGILEKLDLNNIPNQSLQPKKAFNEVQNERRNVQFLMNILRFPWAILAVFGLFGLLFLFSIIKIFRIAKAK